MKPPAEAPAKRYRPMTLAVGFKCPDSILIGTDTHIVTPGVSKLNGSKMFRNEPKNGVNSIIAMAGNFSYGRMAMQHLQYELGNLDSDLSFKKIRDTLENQTLQFHKRHIYPHPDRLSVAVDLLIAVWSPKESYAAIFWTEDSAVVEFPTYACIGTGSTVGHYVIKPMYKSGMMESEVRALAIDAIGRAKEFVDGVGGYTELTTLDVKNGAVSQTERL
jgi:20S proteasome alpha/beta subunit